MSVAPSLGPDYEAKDWWQLLREGRYFWTK